MKIFISLDIDFVLINKQKKRSTFFENIIIYIKFFFEKIFIIFISKLHDIIMIVILNHLLLHHRKYENFYIYDNNILIEE